MFSGAGSAIELNERTYMFKWLAIMAVAAIYIVAGLELGPVYI